MTHTYLVTFHPTTAINLIAGVLGSLYHTKPNVVSNISPVLPTSKLQTEAQLVQSYRIWSSFNNIKPPLDTMLEFKFVKDDLRFIGRYVEKGGLYIVVDAWSNYDCCIHPSNNLYWRRLVP